MYRVVSDVEKKFICYIGRFEVICPITTTKKGVEGVGLYSAVRKKVWRRALFLVGGGGGESEM
jgi:hypothetical protein